MKKLFLFAVAALTMTACDNNEPTADEANFEMQSASADYTSQCAKPVQTVSGDIDTSNNHWTADKVWEIDGIVNVPNNVTLTIDAGTFIKAKPHTDGTPSGVLVVLKGGELLANGTATAPVVFTSFNLLDCNGFTSAKPGDFGGIVLLGDAPTNNGNTTTTIEGLDDPMYQYGGTNSTHDAGSMTYVRIEFGGFDLLAPNSGNEINGLTLGGVGSGTTLDHIQVSYGLDDGFEFFGGTVNASNLIVFAQDDDAFDFDQGYTGTITCALALADANGTHSTSGGSPDSNGIELDNNEAGTVTTLITHPTIQNLTIVGLQSGAAALEKGIQVRRAGLLDLDDAAIVGYTTGISVEDDDSELVSAINTSAHGYTIAKIGEGTDAVTDTIVGTVPSPVFGMSQPFINSGTVNLGARNCGDFFGTWTKYSNF